MPILCVVFRRIVFLYAILQCVTLCYDVRHFGMTHAVHCAVLFHDDMRCIALRCGVCRVVS